ncbi:MAG TPA: transcription termination/antitermination NusG family protein [Gemmataceae bacterium]|nr:transcription termination/antitermination NusG family protein [Gemmataceae bacterium]
MPLLPAEPWVFPAELLTPGSVDNAAARWLVMHTRPRAEKALARQLLGSRVPFFLPLYQRRWRSAGRERRSFLPLFPGYIFLKADADQRLTALKTNLVVQTLHVEDQILLEEDLGRIWRVLHSDEPLSPEERLVPGTLVEIRSGPLAGLQGKVLRRGKKFKLFIEVHFLQRGVSLEIDESCLEPVS